MSRTFNTDIDLDNVARGINSPEPINYGDLVPQSYVYGVHATSVGETSNTSTTVDATKVTLVTPNLPIGNYILEWSFKFRCAGANRRSRVNIKDGVTEIIDHIEHYQDAASYPVISMRKVIPNISGVKTYTLNFRVDGTNTTVFISEATLSIRRLPT